MNAQIVLTPAESKRLIAKGVAASPTVRRALQYGIVAVAKGTTNGYVAEELLGHAIDKKRYVTGMNLPAKGDKSWLPQDRLEDVVLKQGQVVPGAAVTEIVKEMGRADVLIKGANALEPSRRMAGICIAHNMGGTIGATWGPIVARGINLVIPVGLEKLVATPISELVHKLAAPDFIGDRVGMMPVTGEIITEIEALKLLFDVEAEHMASGGVGGAEGAVFLLISGERANVERAVNFVKELQGERPFAEL